MQLSSLLVQAYCTMVISGVQPVCYDLSTLMSTVLTEKSVQLLTQRSGHMCRMGRAEEMGAAVAFLACSDASFITGATLNVDGGYMARGA